MGSESDRLLVQQIRQGNPGAWEDLIARYEGRLLAFVHRRIRDRSTSEDIVQETFIGFLNSLPNYDDRRELQTYLFTIASHKLTDHLRRSGRRPVSSLTDREGTDRLQEQMDSHPGASSHARSVEREQLENAALARHLGQILQGIRERADWTRLKALELLWIKGMANCDVARQLEISEQQVANFRFATVKKLTELIRAAGLSPDVFPELHVKD